MKRVIFVVVFLVSRLFLSGGNSDLLKLRDLYYKAATDKDAAKDFNDFISSAPDVEPTLLMAYRGVSCMFSANYSWNPYNKFSFFSQGKTLLETAIKKDPFNPELRFLRICVQVSVPDLLGYNDMINADKANLLKNYSAIADRDLKLRIKNFLLKTNVCSSSEKTILI